MRRFIMTGTALVIVVGVLSTATRGWESTTVPVALMDVCIDCHDDGCTTGKHRTPGPMPIGESGAGFEPDGTHSECEDDYCIFSHGICVVGDEQLAAQEQEYVLAQTQVVSPELLTIIRETVAMDARRAGVRLAKLAKTLPGTVVYEPQRRAVQVIDCVGRAVAHYPLTEAQIEQFVRYSE